MHYSFHSSPLPRADANNSHVQQYIVNVRVNTHDLHVGFELCLRLEFFFFCKRAHFYAQRVLEFYEIGRQRK